MAITISGENNNDRILAQDGVIDQISGINIVGLITASHINVGSNINLGNAGIITATTFVGNLTGNVNSTSPLLLQTNGGERFRITGNNELGIAGANYGSSGQVLTSGGSGNSVTWSTIPTQISFSNDVDNRLITATGSGGLNGEANLTFNGTVLGLQQSSPDGINYVLDAVGGALFTKTGTFTSTDFNKGHLTLRNTTASQGAFLDFRAASSGGAYGVIAKIGGFNTFSGSGYDGAITFSTRQNSTNTMVERLRIDYEGDITIGKTSGDHILDINASSDEIRLTKESTSDYTGIQLDRDASGNAGGYFGLAGNTNHYINGAAQHDICVRSESNLVFSTGGATERFRITSAGVLQIDQGTSGGNHFKIVNDEISLLAGVNGTGDTYAREAFFGTTRVDSGSLPNLRLAGQGGIKFCVDANSERLIINSSGDYLFLGGTLRIKDSSNSAQRGAIYGDSTSFHVNAGGTLKLYAGGGERFTIANSGGHKITCDESYYAANISECNSNNLAFNINKTRQGQTKGIAFGAIGNGSQRTGIQCYDTSNNSANTLLLNPHGGRVAINITGEPSAQFEIANDSTTGQLHIKHGWASRRFFALPIINNETRWYKIVNYAAGNMLVGSLQIYTTRQGGFNQTKGYNEWKVSYVGFSNDIYGTGAENTSFQAGTGNSVDIHLGGSPKNIYIKVPGSIYAGYVYFIFEGIQNNWQLDDSTYLTSAP